MPSNFPLIDVSTQPIELCKLLKIANMVSGGGEAKIVISEGYVLLNNEVEFQKRKKVYHADIIEFNSEIIQVNVVKLGKDELPLTTKKQVAATLTKQSAFKKAKKKKSNINEKTQTVQVTDTPRSKRKPISF
ncbi:RNA-binding S4 domain-containing protein [Colwellia sp. C1TZA3]|uniref:RNA-binding S4 domain-containing protein n=1 Tax=Colwellia sp. C1TZA3 TaxID=2508879 RepID=UPI0011B9B10E|nr:RNA-binding S4 domain-containing protein [Colwellia sp. C1TZA3]TWX69989.1 RNA-binding S4 domain-containing protein [Colwellia sp. C1TZA3]